MKRSINRFKLARYCMFSLALAFAATSQAETSVGSTRTQLDEIASLARGLRIGVVKSVLSEDVTNLNNSLSIDEVSQGDSDAGILLGYAQILDGEFGVLAQLQYSQIGDNSLSKLEASATYGLNETLFLLGGMNLQSISLDTDLVDYSAALGAQLGIGAQLNKTFGISATYAANNHRGKLGSEEFRNLITSVDVALTATF